MLKKIENLDGVIKFAEDLKKELGLGFHPDDPFENYIDVGTTQPVYTEEESKLRNELIGQAFDVCERENVEIYAVMGRVIVKGTQFENMFD